MSLLIKKLVPQQPAFVEGQPFQSPAPIPAGVSAVLNPLPWWKRAIDLIICVAVLPVLALLTLFMTILTSIVSPGPVFFLQERVGYRGRRFTIYKFRTMRLGVDRTVHESHYKHLVETNSPMTKLDARGDDRLIPGAWLLRASGLDEFPQIFNVLRGDMSLVGPRPCIPSEFKMYTPAQRRRCETLPGLTGLWQVSGKNRTTFEEMINLDVRYGRQLSFWWDVKIILMTVPCLVFQVLETRYARKSSAPVIPPSAGVIPMGVSRADPAR